MQSSKERDLSGINLQNTEKVFVGRGIFVFPEVFDETRRNLTGNTEQHIIVQVLKVVQHAVYKGKKKNPRGHKLECTGVSTRSLSIAAPLLVSAHCVPVGGRRTGAILSAYD